MFCRQSPTNSSSTFQKLQIDLTGLGSFVVVARQNVDMYVIVADVAEDGVPETAGAQCGLIEPQHAGKLFIRDRHVRGNFALLVTPEPFIHQHGYLMTK